MKLEKFQLPAASRDSFKQKQVCCTCGTNLNVGPKEKNFQWAPKWVSYLVLLSPLIFMIVYYTKSKRAKLEIPQCDECEKKEKTYRTVGLILVFGGMLLMFASMAFLSVDQLAFLFALGVLAFFVSLIVGIVLLVKAAIRIDEIDENDQITFMLKSDVVAKL